MYHSKFILLEFSEVEYLQKFQPQHILWAFEGENKMLGKKKTHEVQSLTRCVANYHIKWRPFDRLLNPCFD